MWSVISSPFGRQLWAHCVVTNRLCGMATPRDLRLALHPNSDGQMGNLGMYHLLLLQKMPNIRLPFIAENQAGTKT